MVSSTIHGEISKAEGSTPAEEHIQKQPLAENSVSLEANNGTQGAPNAAGSVSSPVEGLVRGTEGHGAPAAPKNEVEELKPSLKTLEEADALFHKGSVALKDNDIIDAVDSLSRALEIRVSHFGELAPECATSYFKYGCALLYKAQDEADPLNESVALAKKVQASSMNAADRASEKAGEGESSEVTSSDVLEKSAGGESSLQIPASEVSAPCITDAKGKATICDDNRKESATDENNGKEEDDEGEESDGEEAGEDVEEEVEDEEESDLDLAWKNLEAARVILDRQDDTIEKVDIISALGDVSLEREDFSTSANDYLRALSILERLDQAQSRHIAELCFKVCLALQMQNMIPEALSYCQRALSICTSRMLTLTNEVEATKLEIAQRSTSSAGDLQNNAMPTESKEGDIKELKGLMSDLSDKVEDLKQMMIEPPLSEIVRSLDDKSASEDKFGFAFSGGNSKEATVSTGFDEPKLANAPSNGTVTHLGVVGRGAKRAAPVPIDALQPAPKRLSSDRTLVEKNDCSAMEVSEGICQNSEAMQGNLHSSHGLH